MDARFARVGMSDLKVRPPKEAAGFAARRTGIPRG